jgi:hypothetical protein
MAAIFWNLYWKRWQACGSLEWTRQRAEEEADKAIAAFRSFQTVGVKH